MLTPLYLLLGLTVATCVIAYWSDNTGKKLGKKRISLAGLRPRQTATLISMASSVGIMLLTLLVLIAFNKDLRRALFRYDSINARNQQLTREASKLESNITQLRAGSQKWEQQARSWKKQAVNSQKLAESAGEQLRTVGLQLGSAKQQLDQARSREHRAVQRASHAQDRLDAARSDLSQIRIRLVDARNDLTVARGSLASAKSGLTQAKARLEQTRGRLNQVRYRLAKTTDAFRKTSQDYAADLKEAAELQVKVEEQQKRVGELIATRDTLEQTVSGLEENVRTLSENVTMLTVQVGTAQQWLVGNVVVPVDQVLASRTVPAQCTLEQADNALRQLMKDGAVVARQLPLKISDLRLAPLWISDGAKQVEWSQEDILHHLANYLTSCKEPTSVRLMAARNHLAGETELSGKVQTVPVRTVIRCNNDIATKTIDGTQNDAGVFNQLLALVNDGEKNLRGEGVAPPLPNFYAPGTNERIFEALRSIQAAGGPTKVHLIAAEDVTTVDPVQVNFKISKPGQKSGDRLTELSRAHD